MHRSSLIKENLNDTVRLLYENAYSGLLVSLFASACIAFSFNKGGLLSYNDKLVWWLIMLLALGFRFLDIRLFLKTNKTATQLDLLKFSTGVIITAIIWCSYALYFHTSFAPLEATSIIIILSALGGGSANVLSAHKLTCFAYASILLFPYALVLIMSEDYYENVLGFLGIGYGSITLLTLNKASAFTRQAIHLKNQNSDLLERMELRVDARTKEIMHLSNSDSLTQLLNRNAFLNDAKKRIKHYPDPPFALFFIDLDGFKNINDVMGHKVGDNVLRRTAKRISDVCAHNQQKCRWGGDEFLILSDFVCKENTYDFAKEIIDAITQDHPETEHGARVGATIGIALYPEHGRDLDALILNADMAMYHQKRMNRGQISFFSESLRLELERKRLLSEELLTALINNCFSLVYQPIIDSKTHDIYAIEALIRWQLKGENIPPDEFIPIAEQYGLISKIGFWVLETACQQALTFQKLTPDLSVSINVSVMQLKEIEFASKVKSILADLNFPAHKLHLEVTESVFANDKHTFLYVVKSLQELGVRISIDDFGTGYSSLSSMLDVGVDIVKVDKSFVQDEDERGLSIVNAVVQMASSLNFNVIAEGVETPLQCKKLTQLGVTHLQGYYFSRPLTSSALIEYLNNKKAS